MSRHSGSVATPQHPASRCANPIDAPRSTRFGTTKDARTASNACNVKAVRCTCDVIDLARDAVRKREFLAFEYANGVRSTNEEKSVRQCIVFRF